MRILIAQINPKVGDLPKNTQLIQETIAYGKQSKVDLIVFPEMALTGYPPEDLLLSSHFMGLIEKCLCDIVAVTEGISVLLGLPRRHNARKEKSLYNSCAFIQNKNLVNFADKILLPTYDVFDERRYFSPGDEANVWVVEGERVGVTICEDMWQQSLCVKESHYLRNPIQELRDKNLSLLINISASPFHRHKLATRHEVCRKVSEALQCPLIFCNQVGGNDSLLFDGRSFIMDRGELLQQGKAFEEDLFIIDTKNLKQKPVQASSDIEELYHALIMGIRDYFNKTGHSKACLGLSGGVDSAVVACLAKEALGPQSIMALMMPSRFTSKESLRDAKLLADRLGISYTEISIEKSFSSFIDSLTPLFGQNTSDITEENIQSRIRGVLLMAYSNMTNSLLLNTGNKSELALGYCTLYGDMCGALSVLGDVTKGFIYELARYINKDKEIIPSYVLERAPSAELKEGQKDTDSLPEYPLLDAVLISYLEEGKEVDFIAQERNIPIELVRDIIRRIHVNEYKRRQAPLALRVTSKAFCVGRRVPIT